MENEKLNAVETIAREMAPHSRLADRQRVLDRIRSTLDHLRARSAAQLRRDPDTPEAIRFSEEYLVVAELVAFFGGQLIAFEDIARDGISN